MNTVRKNLLAIFQSVDLIVCRDATKLIDSSVESFEFRSVIDVIHRNSIFRWRHFYDLRNCAEFNFPVISEDISHGNFPMFLVR